eukprot:3093352-Alexandrium_andersonii.AAC.1
MSATRPRWRHVSKAPLASMAEKPCREHSRRTRDAGAEPAPAASPPSRGRGWKRKPRITPSGLSRG